MLGGVQDVVHLRLEGIGQIVLNFEGRLGRSSHRIGRSLVDGKSWVEKVLDLGLASDLISYCRREHERARNE